MLNTCLIRVVYFGRVFSYRPDYSWGGPLGTQKKDESDFDPIKKLLQAIRHDPVINKKVGIILKMDAYPRRLVLNTWLEQLRRRNAPGQLTQTLSILFDDTIAQKFYELINKSLKKSSF